MTSQKKKKMKGAHGVEPWTYRSAVDCSTTELYTRVGRNLSHGTVFKLAMQSLERSQLFCCVKQTRPAWPNSLFVT